MTGGKPGDLAAGGGGGSASPATLECAPNHAVLADALVNARDLGGTPLENGAAVACGAIFRGPPLLDSSMTCAGFAKLGVRTVIDLRTPDERATTPDAPCVREMAEVVLAPLPVPYAVSPADYVADLNTTDSVARAFQAFGNPAAYPVYFHCTWGRDRTGVLAAVILRALGAERGIILQEYLLSQATVGAYPESLQATLDEIDRQGGIEAYLAAAGISAEQIAILRLRATASGD